MKTAKAPPPIEKERCQHQKLPGARTSPHALRAVPLRGECYRTHRYAPPPAGRSSAGGMKGRKCYPCPGPQPTPALSHRMGEGEWSSAGRRIQPLWKLRQTGLAVPSPVDGRGSGRGAVGSNYAYCPALVLHVPLAEPMGQFSSHNPRVQVPCSSMPDREPNGKRR